MADETIGSLQVDITGDYSQLQDDLDKAAAAAETSAGAIEKAFDRPDLTSGMESSLTSLNSALGQTDSTMSTVGDSAGHAATGIGEIAPVAHTAAGAAEEAGSSLKDMGEQLVAIGEALVITEGLKEFGDEALNAADNITHASIALTTLTGSGETAKETIEELEKLGAEDGLSFPSLLTAGTRMTAILEPGTDVVELLRNIADGAAVFGTAIESAANKFDQMATAGTASARTLTQLGLSLGSLSDAFNQVVAGADTTASSVAAAFKNLDQEQRVEVLTTALQKLGGTAQQVAQQTFGGQWTQLANQWEAVMAEVGQAILPVISALTDFAKTDVVPTIKELVDDFSQLPAPVKDVAVGIALAAAAAIPLATAAAAIAVGLAGLQSLLPMVSGLFGTFGVAATEAAAAEEAVAVASAEAAATTAIPAVATALIALGNAVILAGAAFAGFKLGQWLDDNSPAFDRFTTQINVLLNDIPGFTAFINKISGLSSATDGLDQSTEKLKNYAASIGIVLTGTYTSVDAYRLALMAAIQAQDGAADSLADLAGGAAKAFDDLEASQSKEKMAADNLKQTYDAINLALKNGTNEVNGHTVSTKDLTVAYNNWIAAQEKLNPYLKGLPDSLAAITGAQQKATDEFNRALDTLTQLQGLQASGIDVSDKLTIAQNNLNTAWTKAHPALDQMNKDLVTTNANLSGVDKIINDQGKATEAWQQAIDTYQQLLAKLQTGEATLADVARGASALEAAFKAANPQLATAGTNAGTLGTGLKTADDGMRTFTAGADGFNVQIPAVSAAMLNFKTGLQNTAAVAVDAGGKLTTALVPGVKDATTATDSLVQSTSDAVKVLPSFNASAAQVGVSIQDAGNATKLADNQVGTFLTTMQAAQMTIKGTGEALNQGYTPAIQKSTEGLAALVQKEWDDHAAALARISAIQTTASVTDVMTGASYDAGVAAETLAAKNFDAVKSYDAITAAANKAMAAETGFAAAGAGAGASVSSLKNGLDTLKDASMDAVSFFEAVAGFLNNTQAMVNSSDLANLASMAGLVHIGGGEDFVTVDEYNNMIAGSGYHISGVNASGQLIYDQIPGHTGGPGSPLSTTGTVSPTASAPIAATTTAASTTTAAASPLDAASYFAQFGTQLLDATGAVVPYTTAVTTAATSTAALATATTTAASSITQSATAVAQAGGIVSQVATATVQAIQNLVPGQSTGLVSTLGAPLPSTLTNLSPFGSGGGIVGSPVTPSIGPTAVPNGVQLTVNVSGNTVMTQQGIQQLTNQIADTMISRLRTVAGLKI